MVTLSFGQKCGSCLLRRKNHVRRRGNASGQPDCGLLAKGKRVYLHLGGVEVLDAAGLGTLAEMAVIAPACGGEFKLCNLPEQIAALLHLTRLSEILDVYESDEEALAAWREDFPEISFGIPAVV